MGYGGAPRPDPAIGQAAQEQAAISRDALNFYKQYYEEVAKPAVQEQMGMNRDIYRSYMDDAKWQRDVAKREDQYYLDKYRPVEEQTINDAKNFDSPDQVEQARSRAGIDVQNATSAAMDENLATAGRMGLNPGSFAALNQKLQEQSILQQVGARDMAGRQRQLDGITLRSGVVSQGRGGQGIGVQYAGLSGNSTGGGATVAGNWMAGPTAAAGIRGQGYGIGTSANDSIMGNLSKTYAAGAQYGNPLQEALGFGARLGMRSIMGMASGGAVRGPGTSTSDSIPARLSDGEYVIPAPVVRKLGTSYFDGLIAKHGSTDNKRALAERKGLKRRG